MADITCGDFGNAVRLGHDIAIRHRAARDTIAEVRRRVEEQSGGIVVSFTTLFGILDDMEREATDG